MTIEIDRTHGKFILSLNKNLCKTCGKDSARVVQMYPSQAWEYYCEHCYTKRKT
jgi:late competence protein required for DNA uptake (superfamily II DNA/RNA helicase)